MAQFRNMSDTSLGLPLGYGLAPGESLTVDADGAAIIVRAPYVVAWLKAGHLVVEDDLPEAFGEVVAVHEEIEGE